MAIVIDAIGDRPARLSNLPPTVNDWTIALHFFLVAAGTGAAATLIQVVFSGSASNFIQINTSADIRLSTSGGSGTIASAISTGAWHFAAMRQTTGNICRAYHSLLGGTFSTLDVATTPVGAVTAMRFGSSGATIYVPCRLAAIKIWDAALTDDEIANERNTIRPRRLDALNEFHPCFPGATERLAGYTKGRNFTEEGTLSDGDSPPIGWGASPIIVGAAAAAAASYELTDYGFFLPDGAGV